MSKILSTAQAKAVYDAIRVLSEVGATPYDLAIQTKSKTSDLIKAWVGWRTGSVYVTKGRPTTEREVYEDVNAFAAAYGLEG
jgi:hypothetical protein